MAIQSGTHLGPYEIVPAIGAGGMGTTAAFQSGIPRPLFKPKGLVSQPPDYFDASSDGKKFIFAVSPSESVAAPPAKFTVVLNWTSLLKK